LNPFAALCVVSIRLYRRLISPVLPQVCRYYPTCSSYAEQALMRHGVLRGGFLAAKRVISCHPLSSGGYDPCP